VNHYLKNWQDGYSNIKEDANIVERKYDAENLLDIKILEFSNIWNVWFGKTLFLPKEYLFNREAVVELFHF
jgi:hypothetical protein